jgi:hypothetical protein
VKDKFVIVKNCITFEIINISNISLVYQSSSEFTKATVVTKVGDKTHLSFTTTADCKQFCENLALELNAKSL